ncbi:MAG TPA: hypothetical protein VHO69_14735, partial [Phototrophicaceae bacterium]|nr:hypothetical protein [Phototrophicaceae bacterium]
MNAVNLTAAGQRTQPKSNRFRQTRYTLAAFSALAILLAVLTSAQAVNVYRQSYDLFQSIAVVSSTNVNA